METNDNAELNLENDFPQLEKNNVDIIREKMKNDPKYCKQVFVEKCTQNEIESEIYARDYIKKHWKEYEKANEKKKMEILSNILYRVDYENSTHLSMSIGITALTEKMLEEKRLYTLIETPTEDSFECIDKIGQEEDRYFKSIVSKFFTYVNRYGYAEKKTDFSIIDKVIILSLPHYLKEISEDEIMNYRNNLADRGIKGRIKVKKYGVFYSQIGLILEKCGLNREELDKLLWYYFRRDKRGVIEQSYRDIIIGHR